MEFVAYYRVSTQKQGQSGLGLEAQKASVLDFIKQRGGTLIAEYVEVESGKRNDRPEIAEALRHAKKSGATLLIAKLDRLARNVAFIANLLESGAEVMAADMPEANRFMLHVMAAVAENEARAISDRTKAALAAKKARGAKLGFANPDRKDQGRACRAGAGVNAAKARDFAENVLPLIEALMKDGMTLQDCADALNRRGVATARGGSWHPATVRNALIKGAEIRAQIDAETEAESAA